MIAEQDSPARVLLVEDNELNARLTTITLTRMGFPVHWVENGLKATEAIEQGVFDIVLMDLEMPVMDGIETARRIRAGKSQSDIPIIAITAHVISEYERRSMDSGMDGFMGKPLDFDKLRSMITDLTRNRPAPMEIGAADPSMAFDQAKMLESYGGNKDSIRKILNKFLEVTPARILDAEKYAREGNMINLAETAHVLKNSALVLHDEPLSKSAQDLEAAARGGIDDDAVGMVPAIVKGFRRLIAEVEKAEASWASRRNR